MLRAALLRAANEEEAVPTHRNAFGQLYTVEFECIGPSGSARLLSAWIVDDKDEIPVLVTCYPV
jgi:hypothetical protein